MADPNGEYATTIGPDAVLKGELSFEKNLRMLGKVEGEITSPGTLLIGEGASLKGNAKVGSIQLDGTVKGNLTASDKVQLSSSSRLEGNLVTARLEVADGAVLVGQCTIGVNKQAGSAGPVMTTQKKPAVAVGAGEPRKK